ncbi:protein BCCIP homolog [Acyrthosiphon pisum]|uniref:Protein BCCIP homolog n=1 Tax=Acyrthosiphon pisum TaxID=7029 RepID=A0A8R1W9L3_ACYPI|nr:protein BCCIP homolog [Acyrthosiphon pisum]XP_029346034.1 protein BCCIP homolog [Acyrthosiphon pisum]|eukprot:XP_003246322.1 PREDICTED: protein BCCIP homolog [Acyrthosiphon pisum]
MEPARKRDALAEAFDPSRTGPDDLVTEMLIDVEFVGRSLEITDFHNIKQLLQQLFLKAPVNLSDMTLLLINQHKIGSVIIKHASDASDASDDDDDDDDGDDGNDYDANYFTEIPIDDGYYNIFANKVFGITSVINITEKTSECVKKLHKLMLDLSNYHSDSDTTRFVNGLLSNNDNQVGLLINERYVNIPAAISVPLFQALRKEMFKLINKKQSYNFDYLIMICKLYKVMKNKKGKKSFEDSEIIWSNGEEEFFDKAADYKFEFCVQIDKGSRLAGNWVTSDPGMIPFRRVLIFSMEKFYSIINQLESLISQ